MRFVIPTLFCLVLALLARGDAPDWAQPPAWSAAPGYSEQADYAQPVSYAEPQPYAIAQEYTLEQPYTLINQVYGAENTMEQVFDAAGVASLPTDVHRYSPLGIRWADLYRNDISFLDDPEYQAELIGILTSIRLAQERRARLAERRAQRSE